MKKKSSLPWKKVNSAGREKNASKCQPRGHANKQLQDKFEVVIKKWWALMQLVLLTREQSHLRKALAMPPKDAHTAGTYTSQQSPKFLQQAHSGEASSKTICKTLLYQCDGEQHCFLPEGRGKRPDELTLRSCDAPKAHILCFLLTFLCKLYKTRKANHDQTV